MMLRMTQIMGSLVALALLLGALWGWGQAARIADNAHSPQIALWAVRSAAVAAVAGAQVLVLSCIVGAVYRRGRMDELFRLVAGAVCTVALIGAIALVVAAR
jgi:hypothetical protein